MRASLALIALVLLPALAHAQETASLTVKVEHVSNQGGQLRIGVYDQATFRVRGSKPVAGQILRAEAGEMTVTFDGLTPGEYGVKAYQDENRNGELDTVMGVMPTEPYALSNDAMPTMSGPPWDDAKFTLRPGATTIVITLHK
jgi:uncharacterized protein (DUF2141 family)